MVTKCKNIAASTRYVRGGRVFKQPHTTSTLLQRGCSFTLPPIDSTQVGAIAIFIGLTFSCCKNCEIEHFSTFFRVGAGLNTMSAL